MDQTILAPARLYEGNTQIKTPVFICCLLKIIVITLFVSKKYLIVKNSKKMFCVIK